MNRCYWLFGVVLWFVLLEHTKVLDAEFKYLFFSIGVKSSLVNKNKIIYILILTEWESLYLKERFDWTSLGYGPLNAAMSKYQNMFIFNVELTLPGNRCLLNSKRSAVESTWAQWRLKMIYVLNLGNYKNCMFNLSFY